MNRRRLSYPHLLMLLLMLAIGPLQAQQVFTCAMMDMVVQGECCCGDHEAGCITPDCDGLPPATAEPCCDRSVSVSIDDEVRQHTLQIKPPEPDTGADPPPAILVSTVLTVPAQCLALAAVSPAIAQFAQPGSETYLLTQRLRI